MKIIIQGGHLDLTPSLQTYIEEKFAKTAKFIKRYDGAGAAMLRVEVARTTKHHKKGEVFYAEANLDIPGGMIRAEAYDEDARKAVARAERTLIAELKKRKGKTVTQRKK